MSDSHDDQQTNKLARILAIKLDDLHLSVRTSLCLNGAAIIYLGDLIQKTEHDLMKIKNFSKGCLQEIKQLLKELDLRLGINLYKLISSLPDYIFEKHIWSGIKNESTITEMEVKNILSYQIDYLNFSNRIINCLMSKKIFYVSDLVKCSHLQLLSIPNFGNKCLKEVIDELKNFDLMLGMFFDDFYTRQDKIKTELKSPQYRDAIYQNLGGKISVSSLEEELRNVASIIKGERDQQIVIKYLGWDGKGKKTFESVAREYGLKRQRVHQIYARLEKKLRTLKVIKNAKYLKLDAALKYITDHLPSETDQIEKGMIRKNITETRFNFEGLETALKLLGKTNDFTLLKVHEKHIYVSQKDREIPKIVINLTKKNIAKIGISNVADITDQVNAKMKRDFTEKFIKLIISCRDDFRWLDKESGWFWFHSLPRNRLLYVIRKILSVAPSIDISELRAGISRFHRLSGLAPTRRVLLELCKQIQWCTVKGTLIELNKPISWEQTLKGTTEWAFASLLKESGPVMRRDDLEKECESLGMNLNTFYQFLTFSPIICRYAIGVYGLPGAKVPPGLIESMISKKKKVVTLDYGWTSEGNIWIAQKLSKTTMKSGVIGIPSTMKEHLQGIFRCKTDDGVQIGNITTKDITCWGLGSFFRRRGEEEDHILIIFNIVNKEAKIYIGDEDMLDERILILNSFYKQ